jgi:hypothetical protein
VTKAVDHLLGRAATDPELQTTARDQIRRPGVLRHVERVLVAHVDDARPDLDPRGSRTDRREERERGRQLTREVVDTKVRAIGSQLFRGDGELNRLDQGI